MSELKKKNKLARLEATITYFIYHKGKKQSCYICQKKAAGEFDRKTLH